MRSSNITLEIQLDETKTPEKIFWEAEDNNNGTQRREVKAMLLSLFDKESLDTFKIDLWTKEMQVSEMDRLMYYTLKGLADSYIRSTNNQELANQMQNFVQFFGEQTKILNT